MTKHVKEKNPVSAHIFHVKAAGCQLRVKRIEPESLSPLTDRRTLVFLHEGLGCIEMWRDFPETLCKATGCNGLIYDRKGYGLSEKFEGPWPVDYLQTESLLYLPALLKVCGIDNAVLVGHSDGGTIALITAAYHPNLMSGIITEAAHIFVEQVTIDGIQKTVQAFETSALREKLFRYHKEHTDTIFYRWADRWLSSEFRNWNIRKELSKITCPALLLQGKDDEYGTRAQIDGIAGQVSGPVRVNLIPDCGHTPHFQAKDTVLLEMTRFIKTLRPLR
ncbi:MAG: alpha/beta hydrolase [Desulfobacterales bacterium]